jgi:hypothetical protein
MSAACTASTTNSLEHCPGALFVDETGMNYKNMSKNERTRA